jgi:hypothetical protein
MGAWQITLFHVYGPEQVMAEQAGTLATIFPNYSRNSKQVAVIANQQIQQSIQQTNQFVSTVGQYIDHSDRLTQGMSNMLRARLSSSTPRRPRHPDRGPRNNLRRSGRRADQCQSRPLPARLAQRLHTGDRLLNCAPGRNRRPTRRQ